MSSNKKQTMKKKSIALGVLALGLGIGLSAFTARPAKGIKSAKKYPTAWFLLPYDDVNQLSNYSTTDPDIVLESDFDTHYNCSPSDPGPICGADFYYIDNPEPSLAAFVVTNSTTPPPVNSSNYTFYPLE
jgi:hypothetical protein